MGYIAGFIFAAVLVLVVIFESQLVLQQIPRDKKPPKSE